MATGQDSAADKEVSKEHGVRPPAIALPKGGGAIRGIGEKFAANPVTGTGSMSVPIATSPGRSGFGPQLSLSYDSGAGNRAFGFGWSLSLPSITRKTDKGLPRYLDAEESDVYILSGAEDLVPVLQPNGSRFEDKTSAPGYTIHRYRPRIEGLFARIERWTNQATRDIHWRSISRDNVTTQYGKTAESRIADSEDPIKVFSWLICQSYDDKGNAIVYEYKAENSDGVDLTQAHERNRTHQSRSTNRYLKRIRYGNRKPNRDADWKASDPSLLPESAWMFEVVFDYDEGHYEALPLDPTRPELEQHRRVLASASAGRSWSVRPDSFSAYRSGFEMRTYRRCRRVLMFHRFAELGSESSLVRATEFEYADLDYAQPTTIEAELAHQGSTRFASFIRSVTQSGFARDETQPVLERNGVKYVTYLKKSLPPLEYEYSKASIQNEIRELDAGSLENLPVGLDGGYQWVDLDGEGVSGILTEQANAWFYKSNLGDGRFGSLHVVPAQASLAALGSGRQQLLDLAGDGQLDLVALAGPTPGFYERTPDEDWEPFREFTHLPNLPWQEPNLRLIDLNGDGHADVLITEDEAIRWYPSEAEEGFGAAEQVHTPPDEEKGPRLLFADGTQSIYLADMCGDGLTDLVRIREGEVCYWPNLGYGRFGAKVTMDNAPRFDSVDQFSQQHVRLADIDGSGTNDIIYAGRDGVRLFFNQSGNRWSEPRRLPQFPHVDNLSSLMTVDLLGNGTACLVWSSPLPGNIRRPLRYIDLMGGHKPHLLVRTFNNLGAETHVHYAPSTKFYLADKSAGTPWITRLPFPVHVVERVETYDRISRNRFVTRYAYHHGYFDGDEREFRGFGMVEQFDTEEFAALTASQQFPAGTNIEESSPVPPILTRTWFHTGVHLGRGHISDFFAGLVDSEDLGEYYRDAQARQLLLDDTVLPSGLTAEEEREACRALKGAMLRQEVYALDGTDKEGVPYIVTEQNFTIEQVQLRAGNRHGVFFTHSREAISYHYERDPADPRITYALTLEVDAFGNVLKSAAVAYGRRQPDPKLEPRDQAKQSELLITYAENDFTNGVDVQDDFRTPLPCAACTYELTGLMPPAGGNRFTFAEVLTAGVGATPIAYEQSPARGVLQKRLIEDVRTLYRPDNLGLAQNEPLALLPLGTVERLALPGESYKLAFTPGLLTMVYDGRVSDSMLETEGRYVHSEDDANWWIPSGRIFFSPGSTDNSAQELAYARQHFFLPHRYRDPFHTHAVSTESFVTYDAHDLLMVETRDALGNLVTVATKDNTGSTGIRIDYRVLQPYWVTDPNGNRSRVAFDILGMVVGTAVMGKPLPATVEGDSLDDFEAVLTEAVILDHLQNPLADPQAILRSATTRLVYNLFAYQRTKDQPNPQPAVVYTVVRETHDAELGPGQQTQAQHDFSYSDGFGREIQKKVQAEPGPVPRRDENGKIIVGPDGQPEMTPNDVSPRWVGTGWTVFNNKGKPVRQYEPFFTDTYRFEFDVRIGVSPVLFYDPVERVVATLHPNHTWEKVIFDPWRQETWDVNDTVLVADPRTDPVVGDFFRRLPEAEYLPTWHALRTDPAQAAAFAAQYPDATVRANETQAAGKTKVHAGTPTLAHADSLGRTFLTVAHNKFKHSNTPPADPPTEEFHGTRAIFDIEGNQREVIDAKNRIVMSYDYDIAGPEEDEDTATNRIHQASMEAGERWVLNDVAGKPIYAWDSRNQQFHTIYDSLRRPVETSLRESAGPKRLIARTIYGETRPNPEASNLRGKVVQLFDQAGMVTTEDYDFKGNLLQSQRQLAQEYKATLDWFAAVPLEPEVYTSGSRFDALSRPITLTTPDNSVIRPGYNEANLLERVEANVRSAAVATPFVTDIDYDAKGQRTLIDYGNDVQTTYAYDPLTFRLTHLKTLRGATRLQDLLYSYDPAGNITAIQDNAQQTIYFNGQVLKPHCEYVYDAVYRLIEAKGREHVGQHERPETTWNDEFRVNLQHPHNGQAMRHYIEHYVYDVVGNFEKLIHHASNGSWTRAYAYREPSLVEPGKKNNRLSSTVVHPNGNQPIVEPYTHDAHGNMTSMPHLPKMAWDFKDQLQATSKQINNGSPPETTYYVYDAAGQRVRKVTELHNGTRKNERTYLGGFEVYRQYGDDGTAVSLERESLHVMDDQQRVALVETRTQGSDGSPAQLIRYQFGNHLGSVSLELDDAGQIISYEEYYPYGSTSHQAGRSATEVSLKRYRFTGKERDEESGLGYHGARYYAPWLGRWTSCDPLVLDTKAFAPNKGRPLNPYSYCADSPLGAVDPDGRDVHILVDTNARDIDNAAVQTRKYEIEHGPGFDPAKDAVYPVQVLDLGKLKETIDAIRADAAKRGFGPTVEFSVWGHASADGPVAQQDNSGPYAVDRKQMSIEGWNKIDFGWKKGEAFAAFYGCSASDFAEKFLKGQQDNGLTRAGYFDTASYPSLSPTSYVRDRNGWGVTAIAEDIRKGKRTVSTSLGVWYLGIEKWDHRANTLTGSPVNARQMRWAKPAIWWNPTPSQTTTTPRPSAPSAPSPTQLNEAIKNVKPYKSPPGLYELEPGTPWNGLPLGRRWTTVPPS